MWLPGVLPGSPIGLTFASAIALYLPDRFNEPAIEVLVFPALLVLELTVFRKWCHRFCPVGALLSLLSRGNRTFKPHVDASMCARHAVVHVPHVLGVSRAYRPVCRSWRSHRLPNALGAGPAVNTCPA